MIINAARDSFPMLCLLPFNFDSSRSVMPLFFARQPFSSPPPLLSHFFFCVRAMGSDFDDQSIVFACGASFFVFFNSAQTDDIFCIFPFLHFPHIAFF